MIRKLFALFTPTPDPWPLSATSLDLRELGLTEREYFELEMAAYKARSEAVSS